MFVVRTYTQACAPHGRHKQLSASPAETCSWTTRNFAKYIITLLSTFLDPAYRDSKFLRELGGVAVTIYQQTRPYTPYDANLCTIRLHCSMRSQVLAREIDLQWTHLCLGGFQLHISLHSNSVCLSIQGWPLL